MRVVIAGATGALGTHVVKAVEAAGHHPVGISLESGVNLMTSEGLVPALRGADAVIDVSATNSTKTEDSVAFFGTVTRNLLQAEKAAGVPHHVTISIIGAAEVNSNYYAGKKVQEDILMAQSGGWSLLRTTQFHEFVRQMITGGKAGPFQMVPKMRSQPISATEVAAELVSIATGAPRGLAPELAGPREENVADLVRRYLAGTGEKRPVIQVYLPGAWGRGMRKGTLLPKAGTRLGKQNFDEWLATVTSGKRSA